MVMAAVMVMPMNLAGLIRPPGLPRALIARHGRLNLRIDGLQIGHQSLCRIGGARRAG